MREQRDATVLLRYTLWRERPRPWSDENTGSEVTSGREADNAHAARRQDDDDEDVGEMHVGRGQTPGPMALRRNKRVYTGLGQ